MQEIVSSFFEEGLSKLHPKVGGWSWSELQAINSGLEWKVSRQALGMCGRGEGLFHI